MSTGGCARPSMGTVPSDPTPEWLPCGERFVPAYLRFAAAMFGPRESPSDPAYLEWLYRAHPAGASLADLIVGVVRGEVIACIHQLKLPWHLEGATEVVTAPHNLMVHPQFRRGIGLRLILAAFQGARHALASGVSGRLAEGYARLGLEPLDMRWYRQVLRPWSSLARWGLARAAGALRLNALAQPDNFVREPPRSVASLISPSGLRGFPGDIEVQVDPPADVLERTSRALNERLAGRPGPWWTADLLRWRCFHPGGPLHFLLQIADRPESQAIFSFGPRRGLAVGRLVAHTAPDARQLHALLVAGRELLRRLGAHLWLAAAADPVVHDAAPRAGLRRLRREPKAFFHHRSRAVRFEPACVQAIATDIGFEALAWRRNRPAACRPAA